MISLDSVVVVDAVLLPTVVVGTGTVMVVVVVGLETREVTVPLVLLGLMVVVDRMVTSGTPSNVMATSAHPRNCSCGPHPTFPVPFGQVPQLFPAIYRHCRTHWVQVKPSGSLYVERKMTLLPGPGWYLCNHSTKEKKKRSLKFCAKSRFVITNRKLLGNNTLDSSQLSKEKVNERFNNDAGKKKRCKK